MPLMTGDLLKYPTLCTQYYETIMYIVEMIPDKVKLQVYLSFLQFLFILVSFTLGSCTPLTTLCHLSSLIDL